MSIYLNYQEPYKNNKNMAIKDLLERIKNNKESEKNSEKEFTFESSRNLIENQLPNNSVWFDKEILTKLSMEELLD